MEGGSRSISLFSVSALFVYYPPSQFKSLPVCPIVHKQIRPSRKKSSHLKRPLWAAIPLDMLCALLYYLPITYTGDAAMTTKISTADVRKNFSNIVNRVSFGKESIILTRRGEEIAALVAMDELRLLQELEDRIDIADAIKAIKEQGEDIPAEQFWKKLGL
jgi:antitoxin Phd